MERNKLTFNNKQVRDKIKSYYCKEFTLPSGKMSGYYMFPITEDEINSLSQDLNIEDKPKKFLTWSEWALFVALRRKYGLNYLHPKTKQERFLSSCDPIPKEENPIEELEAKLLFYCDCKLNDILNITLEKLATTESERDTEENEKNAKKFRNSLDNVKLDVLY